MAHPLDGLYFREIMGRAFRGRDGHKLAFIVAPIRFDQPDRVQDDAIASMRHFIVNSLDYGDVFYVSPEITRFLWDAAMQLTADHLYHFEAQDFPSLAGTVFFDGIDLLPVPAVDYLPVHMGKGESVEYTQNLRAVSWGQMTVDPKALVSMGDVDSPVHGKMLFTFIDRITHRPHIHEAFNTPWLPRQLIPVAYDERHLPTVETLDNYAVEAGWMPERTPEEEQMEVRSSAETGRRVRNLLYVWSQFIQTEILRPQKAEVPKQHDKLMVREGRPPARYTIVALRRYAAHTRPEGEAQALIDHQYRWLVRGHWRNQRVGEGRRLTRPTWVTPHIRGPEDKPLIVNDKVTAVIR